jgi:hypothetical protein
MVTAMTLIVDRDRKETFQAIALIDFSWCLSLSAFRFLRLRL